MGLSNFGKDTVAKTIGGDTVGITGTASATTTTSLTGTGFTASVAGPPDTGGHVGHIVVAGSASPFVYGVILSNTTTVLTIDQWHSMTAPETVGSQPGATTPFCIIPGGAPAFYMGISVATRVFTASDNFLWTALSGRRRSSPCVNAGAHEDLVAQAVDESRTWKQIQRDIELGGDPTALTAASPAWTSRRPSRTSPPSRARPPSRRCGRSRTRRSTRTRARRCCTASSRPARPRPPPRRAPTPSPCGSATPTRRRCSARCRAR
jgi:hypothetical protein